MSQESGQPLRKTPQPTLEGAYAAVELASVDAVLLAHPLIDDACSFVLEFEPGKQQLACAIVIRAGSSLQRAQIRVFVSRLLPRSHVPSDVSFISSIPRSPTGRPRRRSLAHQVLLERAKGEERAQACSREEDLPALERQILIMWGARLGLSDLHPDKSFFEMGGSEEQIIAMLLDAKTSFALRYRLLYESFAYEPTIFCLAEMVRYGQEMRAPQQSAQVMRLIPVREPRDPAAVPTNRPLLYLLPPDGDQGTCFRKLSDTLGREWPVTIVRPAGLLHRTGPYQFEEAVRESAELIREDSAGRPFAVGGFCYGGLLASQIARQLGGNCLGLVVFDTPLPGHPHYPFNIRWAKDHLRWSRSAMKRLRQPEGVRFVSERVARLTLWHAIRILRPALVPVWKTSGFRAIARRASYGDSPFYTQLNRVNMPVLHMYSRDHESVFWQEGLRDWHQVAPGQVTSRLLSGRHLTLFFGKNLIQMSETLHNWFDAIALSSRPTEVVPEQHKPT